MAAHEKETHDCIICASALGTNGGTLTLLCGHPFCAECICRWRQRSWRCPVCRVMDNRELSAAAALTVSGRPGNIGQVSRRLRPMAEHLLAENGDNVLDVLLQLLEGIQDGTLPADMETAVSDAAASSSTRAPQGALGGTSLDRLVLNQLVTVLQATSALSGAGRSATASAGQSMQGTQAQSRPASGHRRRRHPSERQRRAPAPVQASAEAPAMAMPAAVTPAAMEAKPIASQNAEAGPSNSAQPPALMEGKVPVAPLKCDASTQTSDFSDREERRLRTSRLKRESRGAALEGAVSVSPKPRATPCSLGSLLGPSATPAGNPLGAQGAWLASEASPPITGRDERPAPAAADALGAGHMGGKAVSEAASSSSGVPSAAAKGKQKEGQAETGLSTAWQGPTGTEQQFRLAEQPESCTTNQQIAAVVGQGHTAPETAASLDKGKRPQGETAIGSSEAKPEVADESPGSNFRTIRRAWEERFGPAGQARAPPLRKRSLEGGNLSESTSGYSSASFPASGISTPQLPGPGQPSGSAPVQSALVGQSAPVAVHRSASLQAPGPSKDGSSPDGPLAMLGVSAPRESHVHQPISQAPAHATRPLASPHVPVPVRTAQEATSSSGLDVSPDTKAVLPDQAPLPSVLKLPAQRSLAQQGSDSSEVTLPPLPEAPDSATPSASDESFGDPNQGDDSTFVTSRATSLARTITPEDYPPADTAQSFAAEPALPEEAPVLASPEGAPVPSVRLPASLLGRRRTRSEAEEARAARQHPILTAPVVAPPNTATQSLADSGASSPRTIAEPLPEQRASQELSPHMPQIGPGPAFQAGGSAAPESSRPSESSTPRRHSRLRHGSHHSLEREQLLLRAVDEVENLVDNLLAKWNSLPAAEQPAHLGERLEELFLEASMLEAVRNNQVPKPRAMVEDILARVTLLDAELGMHMGPVPPPSPTSSMGSPHATGSGSQVPASKLVGSPSAQAEPAALDALRESALPEDPPAPLQQPREQAVPGTGPGASDGGLLAAPQVLVPLAQASQVLQAAENLPKAPARTLEEPRAPASPLAVGHMTQGTSTRSGHRSGSARAGASERRARRSAAARLAAAPPSGHDAAEAEGALDRFTAFLVHHESELQPRTRQIAELALTLARLSLVNPTSTSEQTTQHTHRPTDATPGPLP